MTTNGLPLQEDLPDDTSEITRDNKHTIDGLPGSEHPDAPMEPRGWNPGPDTVSEDYGWERRGGDESWFF